MARHRNVRSMNYDEEYEGYYDIYGHSVEDDFCISPSTAAEFLYDRNAKAHSMSAYLAPTGESLPEEPENEERVTQESSAGPVRPPDTGGGHDRFDQGELRECLETMQNVVGETIPEAMLLRAAVEHGLNAERALSAVLDATDDPKPQRVRRDRQRTAEDLDDSGQGSLFEEEICSEGDYLNCPRSSDASSGVTVPNVDASVPTLFYNPKLLHDAMTNPKCCQISPENDDRVEHARLPGSGPLSATRHLLPATHDNSFGWFGGSGPGVAVESEDGAQGKSDFELFSGGGFGISGGGVGAKLAGSGPLDESVSRHGQNLAQFAGERELPCQDVGARAESKSRRGKWFAGIAGFHSDAEGGHPDVTDDRLESGLRHFGAIGSEARLFKDETAGSGFRDLPTSDDGSTTVTDRALPLSASSSDQLHYDTANIYHFDLFSAEGDCARGGFPLIEGAAARLSDSPRDRAWLGLGDPVWIAPTVVRPSPDKPRSSGDDPQSTSHLTFVPPHPSCESDLADGSTTGYSEEVSPSLSRLASERLSQVPSVGDRNEIAEAGWPNFSSLSSKLESNLVESRFFPNTDRTNVFRDDGDGLTLSQLASKHLTESSSQVPFFTPSAWTTRGERTEVQPDSSQFAFVNDSFYCLAEGNTAGLDTCLADKLKSVSIEDYASEKQQQTTWEGPAVLSPSTGIAEKCGIFWGETATDGNSRLPNKLDEDSPEVKYFFRNDSGLVWCTASTSSTDDVPVDLNLAYLPAGAQEKDDVKSPYSPEAGRMSLSYVDAEQKEGDRLSLPGFPCMLPQPCLPRVVPSAFGQILCRSEHPAPATLHHGTPVQRMLRVQRDIGREVSRFDFATESPDDVVRKHQRNAAPRKGDHRSIPKNSG